MVWGKESKLEDYGLQAITDSPSALFTECTYSQWLKMLPGPRDPRNVVLPPGFLYKRNQKHDPSLHCKQSQTKQTGQRCLGASCVCSHSPGYRRELDKSQTNWRGQGKGVSPEDGTIKISRFVRMAAVQRDDGSVYFPLNYI